jgi:small subunit ribosomal protein S9
MMSDEQDPDVTTPEPDQPAADEPAGQVQPEAQEQAPPAPADTADEQADAAEAPPQAAPQQAEGEPVAAADAAPQDAAADAGAEQQAPADATAGAPVESGEPEAREGAEKPAVPGAHLEVDIVPEGADPLGREEAYGDPYAEEEEQPAPSASEEDEGDEALAQPISTAAIDLASGARYRATGKRKTAIARVTLRPGSGSYLVNGRTLEQHFPRNTLQRNIRQPLETVGYEDRMDVVARLHGGGISAQAGALRHGVSRALLEADPNLRGELKRRGFLTRDSRAKERKKAGLKKARKRPQFSKR